MNIIEAKSSIKKILSKFSKDSHNIFTPFELCEEMLDMIPNLSKDELVLVLNIEFIYLLRQKFGKDNMKNVWFLTPCEFKKRTAISLGINQNQIIKCSYKDKQIINRVKMPKFHAVIGNPPYQGNLYTEFLNLAYDISSKYVLMVHPGTVYMNEKQNKRQNVEIEYIKKVRNKIERLIILNGNKEFENIALWVPLVVTLIDKGKNTPEISVKDKTRNQSYTYESIDKINKWGNSELYFGLKEKILKQCEVDNLQNHFNYAYYMKEQKDAPYYVNLSQLRGHMSKDKNKIFSDDFYTFVPRDRKVDTERSDMLYFCFDDEVNAENFLGYIKGKFARFALSIYKINMALHRGELKAIPWLDFNEGWNNEKLYKHFELSEDEIEFIEENIPNYY